MSEHGGGNGVLSAHVREEIDHWVAKFPAGRQRSAVIGLVILAFLFATALLASVLATHDPLTPMLGLEPGAQTRTPPCIHLLGCPAAQPQAG